MNEEKLDEILRWLRLYGKHLLARTILPAVLDSKKKRVVYEMTDGEKSVDEISRGSGVSLGAISNWWNQWYEKGILTKEGKRYKRLMSLKAVDFERGGKENG